MPPGWRGSAIGCPSVGDPAQCATGTAMASKEVAPADKVSDQSLLMRDRHELNGPVMRLSERLSEATTSGWARWRRISLLGLFDHVIVLFLTALISVIVVLTVWSLGLKVFVSLRQSALDPTDPAVFQSLFGMIFTVIIALEFRRTILVVAERQQSIVHVRAVILIALLAIVRKIIILDLTAGESAQLFGLSAAILSLGTVYWLMREEKRNRPE
jgi:uncharacterized membrane protein (DUF373 family)